MQQRDTDKRIVKVYESHGQDARYKPLGEVCETLSAKYGLGGGNVPIVLAYTPSGYGEYIEGVGTLKANGGDCGGQRSVDSEVLH